MTTNGGPVEPGSSVGEVVEASTTQFVAHSRVLYDAPPLGSLVKSERDGGVYGIVVDIATQSLDPGRHSIAMGQEDDTADDIYRRHPQLGRLLSTEFRSMVVGHRVDDDVRRYLAPVPPRIHSAVYRCEPEETLEFSSSLDFLAVLLAAPVGSQDEAIASFLRQASRCHPDPDAFLVRSGKELALLLVGQIQRLNGLLRRLGP